MPAGTGPGPTFPPLEGYDTLAEPVGAETRVQRSRFLCKIVPARTEAAARKELAEMARRYHDARHLCHAWRLGPPEACVEARNDAGEPAGTAGEPILSALRQAGLTDCVAMVVRYFGGIKLGTGGLSRAYGEVASLALARAKVTRVLLGCEILIHFAYTHEKTVTRLLAECRGHKVEQDYAESVTWRVWLPRAHRDTFIDRIIEATAAEATIAAEEPANRPGPKKGPG